MKKLIALGLAGVMAIGCGVNALAYTANYTPGDTANDPDTEISANVGSGTSGNSKTEFWLTVRDKSGDPPSVDVTDIVLDGNKVYSVTSEDKSTNTFSITVPLYVAMYGYGKTGAVVAPDKDKYQLENSSTQKTDKVIKSITEYIKLSPSLAAILGAQYNGDGGLTTITTDEELKTIQQDFNATVVDGNGKTLYTLTKSQIQSALNDLDAKTTYYFYLADSATAETKINAVPASLAVTVDGQGTDRFFKSRVAEDKSLTTYDNEGTGTAYTTYDDDDETDTPAQPTLGEKTIGDQYDPKNGGTTEGLKVKISNVKATTTNGWSLVEQVSSSPKEMFMTINGTDMSKATGENGLDTDGSNWAVAAPSIVAEGENAGKVDVKGYKNLPIQAAIAANQNGTGDSQVVSISYTVDQYNGTETIANDYTPPAEP